MGVISGKEGGAGAVGELPPRNPAHDEVKRMSRNCTTK
jgi:hypothetical protein